MDEYKLSEQTKMPYDNSRCPHLQGAMIVGQGITKCSSCQIVELEEKINELESKIAEYHNAYEGKKHRIYELEARNRELVKALKDMLFAHQNADPDFPHQFEIDAISKAKQALANHKEG